jgi:glycogen synthase
MRILYCCEAFRPCIGGLEVLSGQFVPAMGERGHDIAVLTTGPSSQLAAESPHGRVTIQRLEMTQALVNRDLAGLRARARELQEFRERFQPDIIHWNDSGPTGFFFSCLREFSKTPALLALHAPVDPSHRQGLQGKLVRQADWVVAVSNSLLHDAREVMPAIRSHSSVILNGLRVPDLSPTPVPFEPPTLLCVGRVVREKGFDIALRALARLRKNISGIRMIIAGDGMARPSLEELARELRLADCVEFTHWVEPERVPELINRATMVLMPGRWKEPFGLVALQGAQMARPVVATPLGGLPEVIVDGATGVMVPPESDAALADAIDRLLADPQHAIALGLNARRRAREVFGFDHFLTEYEMLYRHVVERHSRASENSVSIA